MSQGLLDGVASGGEVRSHAVAGEVRRESKAAVRAGWGMSGLAGVLLVMDAVAKLVKPPAVVEATVQLGYPEGVIVGLGVVLLGAAVLYLVSWTAVLGAVLLTGYLGGAVATNLRVGAPWGTHVLFPVYFGVLIWGGLWLRDRRVRALLPIRSCGARGADAV